jgi:plastocyanin
MQGMGSTRPSVGVALLTAAIAVLLVGCGGGGDGTDRISASTNGSAQNVTVVTIQDYLYDPARITVPEGTTITFANRDSTPHTATSKEPGRFDSGSIDTGKSGEVVLDETGTFAYYCLFHPFMKGAIVVK